MSDCIFCKIANHEIPSSIVYEDDKVIAFDDLNPQAPVHVLVVPKDHYENIVDGVPADVAKALLDGVAAVAEAKGVRESGFRVVTNTGAGAGQVVMHLHLHVLGGKQFD